MKTALDQFTEIIPGGGMPLQSKRAGEFLCITESDWPIEFNIPEMTNGYIRCELGFEYRMAPGESFSEISFRNADNADACNLSAYVGFGSVTDRRLNVVATRPNQFVQFADAITKAVATPATLAPGDEATFSGEADNADLGQRKHLIITNPDPTASLLVLCKDSGGTTEAICAVVGPKNSLILESSDSFTVKNPADSGATFTFYALESFYYARA